MATSTLRLSSLKGKVEQLYQAKDPNRAELADFMYEHHVFLVADEADKLATRFGANAELAVAGAMLHDIADARMSRANPIHEEESLRLARVFLRESNFAVNEIAIIVEDAVRLHSCKTDLLPHTPEGKVVATADAVVHLTTDFYDFLIDHFQKAGESAETIRNWGLEKVDRDLNKKIFFPEVKEEVRPQADRRRQRFQSLTG